MSSLTFTTADRPEFLDVLCRILPSMPRTYWEAYLDVVMHDTPTRVATPGECRCVVEETPGGFKFTAAGRVEVTVTKSQLTPHGVQVVWDFGETVRGHAAVLGHVLACICYDHADWTNEVTIDGRTTTAANALIRVTSAL